jgi:hypothetical protein
MASLLSTLVTYCWITITLVSQFYGLTSWFCFPHSVFLAGRSTKMIGMVGLLDLFTFSFIPGMLRAQKSQISLRDQVFCANPNQILVGFLLCDIPGIFKVTNPSHGPCLKKLHLGVNTNLLCPLIFLSYCYNPGSHFHYCSVY